MRSLQRGGNRLRQLQPAAPGLVDAPGPGGDSRERGGGLEVIVSGTKELAASRDGMGSDQGTCRDGEAHARCRTLEIHDEKHWTAKVKVPLGIGGLNMTINFERLEEREPGSRRCARRARASARSMDMTTSFTLSEAGGGTSMAWEADVKIAARSARWGSACSSRS